MMLFPVPTDDDPGWNMPGRECALRLGSWQGEFAAADRGFSQLSYFESSQTSLSWLVAVVVVVVFPAPTMTAAAAAAARLRRRRLRRGSFSPTSC